MATEQDDRTTWRDRMPGTRSKLASGLVVAAIVLSFVSGSVEGDRARVALLVASFALIAISIVVFVHASRAARRGQGP